MHSPKVTVSCRLGAYRLHLSFSTTERVLSSVVCVSRGAHSHSFCLLLSHPRGCMTTDNTRTKHSSYSTACQSTKPFGSVSTLTDAVAPTALEGKQEGRRRWNKMRRILLACFSCSLISSCLRPQGKVGPARHVSCCFPCFGL